MEKNRSSCIRFYKTVFFFEQKVLRNWDSTEELRQAVRAYIDFYNNHRIKIGLSGKTITEYRAMIAQNV